MFQSITLPEILIIWLGVTVAVFLGRLLQFFINKAGNYELKCKYPKCHFKISVSDKKYSYIADGIMADHQNRFHPLEELNS